ncbi:bifunctional polysaccharide deacetylase/glycosyltransferase family 2 protein [Microbacterium sp. B2969]|uniref:Bifunctional polysaccharide deacetylase/glycosyltransferase family 2 protein n=1 Tax=Microbacterium alkaliflavum TaxID=3248839 RepID=A0ABW7QBF6_9MICO
MTSIAPTRRAARRAAASPRARIHWIALAVLIVGLATALLVHGVLHRASPGQDAAAQSTATSHVPAAITTGGPVIDASADPRTASPRDRTVALTFDDGPDPEWTPQILRILREHGVHATFFVVGSAAIEHPDIVREIVADGNEIGVHTLTHVDLGTLPEWARSLELGTTQRVLAAASGVTTSLFRPPYSATNAAVSDSACSAMQSAADDGYLSVLSTTDSRDWTRPGAQAIVDAAMPSGSHGEIVLMHDGGGDRSETVEALDALLTSLESGGYEVTTVGHAVGLDDTMTAARPADVAAGSVVIVGATTSEVIVAVLVGMLAISGLILLIRAVLVVGAAIRHVRRTRSELGEWRHDVWDPVTVIVPAHNESAGIEAAVRSIAASTHEVEILVVDDGSTDGTADLVEALALPRVRVIRQANGGKPAALNAGLREASHELIVMIDGDTVFEPETIGRLVRPFADPIVGAVSGNTKVANRHGLLGSWQHIEYVVGFNLDRRLFDVAECMPTVPGAIGAFRRSVLERIGGVPADTLAEDTDLTMAIGRDGWRVVYQEDAIAWTEAPASFGALWKQRYRWCYGTLQAMWKHRRAVTQSGAAGTLGRRGLGYLLVLQVLLPLFAPAVDLFALYGLFFLDAPHVLVVWLAFLLVQMLMALFAFALDGESPKSLWTLPLQQFVYRQFMYLVVVQSVFTALAGTHLRWHRMERYGSLREPARR